MSVKAILMKDQSMAGIFILYLDFIAAATLGAYKAFADANSDPTIPPPLVVIVPWSRRTPFTWTPTCSSSAR